MLFVLASPICPVVSERSVIIIIIIIITIATTKTIIIVIVIVTVTVIVIVITTDFTIVDFMTIMIITTGMIRYFKQQ